MYRSTLRREISSTSAIRVSLCSETFKILTFMFILHPRAVFVIVFMTLGNISPTKNPYFLASIYKLLQYLIIAFNILTL